MAIMEPYKNYVISRITFIESCSNLGFPVPYDLVRL